MKLHSKRVEKMCMFQVYNAIFKFFKNLPGMPQLSTYAMIVGGPGAGKVKNYTRNEWGRYKITLETGGKDVKLHSKRVEKM